MDGEFKIWIFKTCNEAVTYLVNWDKKKPKGDRSWNITNRYYTDSNKYEERIRKESKRKEIKKDLIQKLRTLKLDNPITWKLKC